MFLVSVSDILLPCFGKPTFPFQFLYPSSFFFFFLLPYFFVRFFLFLILPSFLPSLFPSVCLHFLFSLAQSLPRHTERDEAFLLDALCYAVLRPTTLSSPLLWSPLPSLHVFSPSFISSLSPFLQVVAVMRYHDMKIRYPRLYVLHLILILSLPVNSLLPTPQHYHIAFYNSI